MNIKLPRFFTVRQKFERHRAIDIPASINKAVEQTRLRDKVKPGQVIAITVGSRGIANIAAIAKAVIDELKSLDCVPFIVPAMGSHGGATAEGQQAVLAEYGITAESMGCEIRSSMDTHIVCEAAEGFPVHFDKHAFAADHVIVMNRIKPHTRFFGSAESGLMKMMLIGLGKHAGACIYHQVIQNFTFDQIVRSVAREVIAKCHIIAGIAILENGYEETAEIVGMEAVEIENIEPVLLKRVRQMLPQLPFDHAELLIVDEMGKDVSGTGMDTNVIGRKSNDKAAMGDEKPNIHHIYVRSLTSATAGNGSGIGIAEMCHQKVIEQIDRQKTRVNCITAGHISAGAIPIDFINDRVAIQTAISMGGWGKPESFPAIWIRNTLKLEEIRCSEYYWNECIQRSDLEIISALYELTFDEQDDLVAENP